MVLRWALQNESMNCCLPFAILKRKLVSLKMEHAHGCTFIGGREVGSKLKIISLLIFVCKDPFFVGI